MVLGWRHGSLDSVEERELGLRTAPGKVTSTRLLYRRAEGAAVRPPSEGAGAGAGVGREPSPDPFDFSPSALGAPMGSSQELATARAGFGGASSPFPFREQIERSFGRALPATAFLDETAAQACGALGAEGYALGSQVAFRSSNPSLEVAAHEAAHVMQATSGVELFGGDGAYEAHADEVAARVVRGESAAGLLAGGPAAGAAVRYQRAPGSGVASSAGGGGGSEPVSQPGAQGAPAAPTVRQRMATAITASDLPAVLVLQRQLRQQLVGEAQQAVEAARPSRGTQRAHADGHGAGQAEGQGASTPTTQPAAQPTAAEAREALADARHWMMRQIAAIRDRHAAEVTAARDGTASPSTAGGNGAGARDGGTPQGQTSAADGAAAAQGQSAASSTTSSGRARGGRNQTPPAPPSHTSAVEAVEVQMDTECTPYLDGLLEGDPEVRYQHPDAAVAAKVFEAVRLHAMRRGVSQIGHRDAAEAEARAHGGVATAAWCGAFAFTQAEMGSGFDRRWAENMAGEGGIRSALAYGGHAPTTWVWADGRWQRLRDYHVARGSERWYETVRRAPPSRGIQAGDLALIDNSFGTNPDHVTTVISFDGRYLTTVGGNQGDGEAGVSRSREPFDLTRNPEPNDVRRLDAEGHPMREADRSLHKNVRVHGIGRWSIVDYERRIYRLAEQQPTEAPNAEELAHGAGR